LPIAFAGFFFSAFSARGSIVVKSPLRRNRNCEPPAAARTGGRFGLHLT
jgi:hypothetical protein